MSRDYNLALTCTDRGQHEAKELAVLIPVRPRADLAMAAAMGAEIPEPTGEYAKALARGWDAQGSYRTTEGGRWVQPFGSQKEPVEICDGRNGPVVRLRCRECGRSPNISAAVLFTAGDAVGGDKSEPGERVELDVTSLPPTYW